MTAPRRILLIDPGLRDDRGHHANFARLLRGECGRRDAALKIGAHRDVAAPLAAYEIGAAPVFRDTPYQRPRSPDPDAAEREFLALNDRFETDLQPLASVAGRSDLVLVPTITQNQLLGLARWIDRVAPLSAARFAIMLMLPPDWGSEQRGALAAMRRYGKCFAQLAPHRDCVILHAETATMAEAFEHLCRRPVAVNPWPVWDARMQRIASDRSMTAFPSYRPLIGYLGHARPERGFDLMPGVIRRVLAQRPDARFLVQCTTHLPPEAITPALDELATFGTTVELVRDPLPRGDYLRRLAALDLLLLPYRPEAYRLRGSGLFSEAVMLGRPVVAPRRTSMAVDIERSGLAGVIFDDFSAQSISKAVHEALRRLEPLQQAAQAAAPPWRAARTMSAYLDRLTNDHGDWQEEVPRWGITGAGLLRRPAASASPAHRARP